MAVFWERTTEPGAFWGLMSGLVIGSIRMLIEFSQFEPGCGDPDSRAYLISKIHYLHFSMILAPAVLIVTVIVSLLTPPIPSKYLRRLTYWTRNHPRPRVSMTTLSQEKKKLREEKFGKEDKKDTEPGCLARCIKEENTETDIRVNVQGYSIKEKKSWNIAANVGAVLVTCTTFFLFG